jgi:type IV pilus assembly protein PilM
MGILNSIFSSKTKRIIGIDIGAGGIKLVELKKSHGLLNLDTYGFTENSGKIEANDWLNDLQKTARVIKKLCSSAGTKTNDIIAALPTFSVFSSVINIVNVSREDLDNAVRWEAKKIIPLPIDDMVLAWNEIPNGGKKNHYKILLTGAPKDLVNKYKEIFKLSGLNLLMLETETFSLIRSLLGNDKATTLIAECGASTTDISVVSKSIPLLSRSLDVGGLTVVKALGKSLNVSTERAEQFVFDLGISTSSSETDIIPKTINEAVAPIVNEIKYIISLYESKNNDKVTKIMLSGGSAMLPGLEKYLAKLLNINTIIGDPWARISYPVDLEPALKEVGPRLAVAIGLAMKDEGQK